MPNKNGVSEHEEQVTVIQWCLFHTMRYPALDWIFAVPNGAKLPKRVTRSGKMYSPQAKKLLSEGLRPGVSDLVLPFPNGQYHGLFIEMKVKPNKPTKEQAEFVKAMNERGYKAVVCYGSEAAIDVIRDYVGIPDDDG